MSEIRACVSERILQTVDRMFTGSVSGRITELLQNARRAGAKNVYIKQTKANDEEYITTVEDDGCGVDDFSTLLNAGKTDWNHETQQAEDPAGLGLFCLAPRTLTLSSGGRSVCIEGDGWRGAPVKVIWDGNTVGGTKLQFKDAEWKVSDLERCSAFSGLEVHLDHKTIHPRNFIITSVPFRHIPELGVKIQVEASSNRWSEVSNVGTYYSENYVYFNFHGQVIAEHQREVMGSVPIVTDCGSLKLRLGVELTGEPTDLRMILPARTGVVRNKAFERLGIECEKELYRWIQNRGHHTLSYANFQRALKLGIDIGESEPVVINTCHNDNTFSDHNSVDARDPVLSGSTEMFVIGFDGDEDPEPEDGSSEREELILSALNMAGVGVGRVDHRYDGYKWVQDLVTLDKVTVRYGEEMFTGEVQGSQLTCVPEITFRAEFSNGEVKEGELWACPNADGGEAMSSWSSSIIVTPDTIKNCYGNYIWHCIGGWDEDSDWDTSCKQFEEEYEDFTDQLVGPDESVRRRVWGGAFDNLWGQDRDQIERVELDRKGNVTIHYQGDQKRVLSVRED